MVQVFEKRVPTLANDVHAIGYADLKTATKLVTQFRVTGATKTVDLSGQAVSCNTGADERLDGRRPRA